VSKYLQEYCIIDSTKKDYMTKTSELYQHYVRVCRENMQVRELDENVFGSKLVEHGIMKRRRRIKGQRTLEYVYEPLMIKHNLLKEQDSIFQLQQEQQPTTVTNSTTGAIAHEQSTITTIRAECPYCALENEAGNSPLFYADTVREVQVHIVLEHPGLDFEGIIEES
jgi:phage/plasmid-associated DNA primase